MTLALNRTVIGDCREALRELPAETFHCCVTSPPYWGLRDYGVEGQLGLEATHEEYVARMVEVFREVRRVLRNDGTLWLNLGDSYAGSWGAQSRPGTHASPMSSHQIDTMPKTTQTGSLKRTPGLKSKDLIGLPWRVAFALQVDGWWLRSEIIWAKPNPMPESITDRPTKAHEQVFLFSKSSRYFYDAGAIAEPLLHPADATASDAARAFSRRRATAPAGRQPEAKLDAPTPATRNARDVWTIPSEPYSGAHFATMPRELARRCILAGCSEGGAVLDPFHGSGTVGQVAEAHGRRWFGVELNPAYAPLIAKRTAQVGMVFAEVEP
jgi:DNA modification methylase